MSLAALLAGVGEHLREPQKKICASAMRANRARNIKRHFHLLKGLPKLRRRTLRIMPLHSLQTMSAHSPGGARVGQQRRNGQ